MGISTRTMGFASLGMQIAGGMASTVGSYYSALGDKRALQLQAEMADRNALHAYSAGTEQASNVLQRGAQIESSQRASMAANGVDLTEGSPAAVIASTEVMRQNDANTTINNAMQEAFGYRAEAVTKRAAADAISPGFAAGTTLLDQASKVAATWTMGKKMGLYDKSGGKKSRVPMGLPDSKTWGY